jgi:hypothetical protein
VLLCEWIFLVYALALSKADIPLCFGAGTHVGSSVVS